MNKTIKVIELLNKIAKGEEVPKRIKYGNMFYTYDESGKDYITEIEDNQRYTLLFNVMCTHCMSEILEATVEIIEEEPEIEIQGIEEIKDVFIENSTCGEDVKYLARKYNQLVQAVKQLDRQINGNKTGDK